MSDRVLVDTGPLVAFLDRRDAFHQWASMQLAEVVAPVFTCEPVLSEACFLLRRLRGGSRAVLELVVRGLLRVDFRADENAGPLARLLSRYADVPMSLADACLVRMAELHPGSVILTLDRDFRVYRRHGRHVIPVTMPGAPSPDDARRKAPRGSGPRG